MDIVHVWLGKIGERIISAHHVRYWRTWTSSNIVDMDIIKPAHESDTSND